MPCRVKDNTRLYDLKDKRQRMRYLICTGEIVGNFTDDAIGIDLQIGVMMKSSYDVGANNKDRQKEWQTLNAPSLEGCFY